MDALDLLEQQHRDVGDLLERIAQAPGRRERSLLVARVARTIDAHTRSEERHLYPACTARMTRDPTLVHCARERLGLARFAAETLAHTPVTDARFAPRLAQLTDLFARHVCEEERHVFPRAKSHLTDEQLELIGSALAETFERFATPRPVRRGPRRTARSTRAIGSRRG